ncbi:MAG: transposase [Thermoanaerobaculia bacterium]
MQRYLGIDVHSKSSTIYVMSTAGKKVRQDVLETNGQALIGYLAQIPGQLHVCLEEGEWSAWLHEILEPHVAEIVVEQPQKKTGSKSDAIDARDLAEHLRTGQIETEVYKAPRRFTKLRELARTYDRLTEDSGRARNRLRSVYRRRAVPYPGHGLAAQAASADGFRRDPDQQEAGVAAIGKADRGIRADREGEVPVMADERSAVELAVREADLD